MATIGCKDNLPSLPEKIQTLLERERDEEREVGKRESVELCNIQTKSVDFITSQLAIVSRWSNKIVIIRKFKVEPFCPFS